MPRTLGAVIYEVMPFHQPVLQAKQVRSDANSATRTGHYESISLARGWPGVGILEL